MRGKRASGRGAAAPRVAGALIAVLACCVVALTGSSPRHAGARAFAVPGGIGDIVVATFALPVALAPLAESSRLRAIYIWNVVGLVDTTLVVVTAARLNLADPSQLHALTHLPLSLLPTFLVPLIVATHVIIFARVARARHAT